MNPRSLGFLLLLLTAVNWGTTWPILGEKPRPARILALFLGFGSIAMLFAGQGASLGLEKLPGLILILASALCFGLGAVLSKRWPLSLHPISSLTWQMGIGSIPIAMLAPLLEHFEPGLVSINIWLWFGWFTVFCMAVSYFTWFGALARLPASTATLGTLLAPLLSVIGAGMFLSEPLGLREWAALFAWPILGEKPRPARIVALALGFGSIAMLFAGQGASLGVEKLPGLLLILASALCFGLGAVLSKRWPLTLHPVSALTWQMAIGSIPIAMLAPLLEHFEPGLVSTGIWLWFVWFTVFCMAMSYFTWFGALARLPASTATLGTLLAPVLSVIGAGFFLGETLGLREWAALGGTVAAVALAVGSRDKPA